MVGAQHGPSGTLRPNSPAALSQIKLVLEMLGAGPPVNRINPIVGGGRARYRAHEWSGPAQSDSGPDNQGGTAECPFVPGKTEGRFL